MPNISALEKLNRFIENEELRTMRKWSTRVRLDSSNRIPHILRKFKAQVRKILNLVSGNDIIELLKGISLLKSVFILLKDVLTKQELDALTTQKYKAALTNLTEHYNQTPQKERHNILRPIKNVNFNFKQVKKFGFKASRHLWKTSLNRRSRNLGGGSPIPNYLKNAINVFLKEKSAIASNRLVKIKDKNSENYKETTTARYLEDRKSELFKNFPLKDEISKATFYKYANISGIFKNPYRLTDLCEYCEEGRTIKKQIDAVLKQELHEFEETYDIELLVEKYKSKIEDINSEMYVTIDENMLVVKQAELESFKTLIRDLEDYSAIMFHKNVAKAQRIAYNRQRKDIDNLSERILIEIDFKEKVVIGFGIYYTNNNQIELINFDVISNISTQDGLAAVRGFKLLREQPFFKEIEKKEYIVWADCGKHFRCNKLVGYLLRDLADKNIHVNLNFFCDKHGKNSRDAHFSNITRFIRDESLVKKIESSQDVVEAILKRQRMSNENKKENLKEIKTYAVALDEETTNRLNEEQIKTLSIQNLESFYNYQTAGPDFDLVTTVLSNHDQYINFRIRQRATTEHAHINVLPEKVAEVPKISKTNFYLKKSRINCALNQSKQLANQENVNTNKDFYEYFANENILNSLSEETDNTTSDSSEENDGHEIPNFCRPLPGTAQKRACFYCDAICQFPIERIIHPNNQAIGDILVELQAHGHPKCRKFANGRQRVAREAARELADHYIYAHHQKEPIFR